MISLSQATKSLRISLLIAGVIGLATGAMAWYQVQRELRIDLEDVDRRAHVLAHQLSDTVRDALKGPDAEVADALGPRLEGYRRLIGFAVFRPDGRLVASGKAVTEFSDSMKSAVTQALRGEVEVIETVRSHGSYVHIWASRLQEPGGGVKGVLVALHDVSNLDDRYAARLVQFAFWILIVTLLLMTLVVAATWTAYDRPLQNLADWMRRLRTENVPESPPRGLPTALLASESDRLAASFRAARSAGSAHSRASVREHNVWTRERLRTHAVDCLQGGQLIVVSNREPYMHQLREGKPHMIVPAGGLVTALDPVLQACGGVWVAHGGGDADRETADGRGRLTVPAGDSRYTLRRVWLTREEEQGYYYGLSN
jgi:trehalose 6-phosphate synthase